MGYSRVLARPYFLTLYVIFPVHVNFPLRLRNCICMLYVINFFRFTTICSYFSCFFTYHLWIIFHYIMWRSIHVVLNIPKGFFYKQFCFNILNIWKNSLFFLFTASLILFNKNKASSNFKAHMLCLSSNFLLHEMFHKKESI